ncbi:hypothetical protein ABDK00_014050 [Niabella insulamsoli]|uniref:hypothetical protein n=1 Tax=Niabella insulamsoli TaxID=3144874 RepID=UPI0031FD1BDD
MSDFKDILKIMDEAIEAFENAVPGVQEKSLEEIINLTKELETRNGKIINSVKNLRLIGQIKTKLKRATLSQEYKKAVKSFVASFEAISALQISYFKRYVPKFEPERKLGVIREYAIDQTIYDLMGQGMDSQVVEPVTSILRDNITSGGSYAKFQQQLADYLIDNASGEGRLMRYTKQITTDAIHQYSAQYHEAIAQDLGFKWGRYVGSDIETTREFCDLMTDRDYFHVSELSEILKGHIDGRKCKLSKTTGLPVGMIPGTNTDNFKIRRGGYNCRHGVYMIPESAVPENIKSRLKK